MKSQDHKTENKFRILPPVKYHQISVKMDRMDNNKVSPTMMKKILQKLNKGVICKNALL